MKGPLKEVVATALTLCAAFLPGAASAAEAAASEAAASSAPVSDVGADYGPVAARYDVGGRSLFLVCVGPPASELPTVIAEGSNRSR